MSKISDKVSEIFGFRLKEGEWQRYIDPLDREGEPTRKHMGQLLFVVCEEIENLRKDLDMLLIKEKYVKGNNEKRDSNKPL